MRAKVFEKPITLEGTCTNKTVTEFLQKVQASMEFIKTPVKRKEVLFLKIKTNSLSFL
jgi:hypothetical protein